MSSLAICPLLANSCEGKEFDTNLKDLRNLDDGHKNMVNSFMDLSRRGELHNQGWKRIKIMMMAMMLKLLRRNKCIVQIDGHKTPKELYFPLLWINHQSQCEVEDVQRKRRMVEATNG